MACDNPTVSVTTNEVWTKREGEEFAFSHTAVVAFKGSEAYHGTVKYREHEFNKDDILDHLKPIPPEHIYPEYQTEFTRAPSVYLKAPTLSAYNPGSGDQIAQQSLHEVRAYERFKREPHPSIGEYLGCVIDNGRITRLALVKYEYTLLDRMQDKSREKLDLVKCMEAIESGVRHIHKLGLAHNDLNPMNIMFKADDTPVIIDFDTCLPIGAHLSKGGLIGGWNGSSAIRFSSSSKECDEKALESMREWMGISQGPEAAHRGKDTPEGDTPE